MKKVTYNKVVSIFMACLAILSIYLGYTIGNNAAIGAGCLILLLSILYLINTAIKYNDSSMQVKSPLGLTIGDYTFKKDKFVIKDENLEINGKKLKVSPLMLDKTTYHELLIHIASKTEKSKKKKKTK